MSAAIMDMREPGEAFCSDCPDHEGCMTGYPCSLVKRADRPGSDAAMSAELRDAAKGMRAEWAEGELHISRVMLAVAEWLESKAEQDDKGTCDDPRGCCNLCEHDYGHVAALAVARAYLGRDA